MQVSEFNARVYRVPGGDAGTWRLGIAMVAVARSAAADPSFISWTRAIVRDIPSKANHVIARRLLEWDRARIKYRYDSRLVEYLQDPRHTLLVDGGADCDDQAAVVAAQGLALGYDTIIRFVKADASRRDEVSHVYTLLAVPDGVGGDDLIALDTTQAHAEPGWQPPHWFHRDFPVATWTPATAEEARWFSFVQRQIAAGEKTRVRFWGGNAGR